MAVICQSCAAELATWEGRCPLCGGTRQVAIQAKQDPLIDKVIGGRYRVLKKLGQGGMGSVYLAEHTGVGQKVAIKFLNPSFSGDPDIVRRFLNEARSYGQLSHPHAVQLHDFGQGDDGALFIAMELIEGRDLKRVLEEEKRLPLKDALDVALQLCDVLGYAHSKGIIHRDLKPENVMLTKGLRGYHAKVLDFGVARLIAEQGTRLTAAGSICGTPRYMSPEQAEGRDVDHRTDIYSLGLVLLEMVTGTHPFAGGSIAEILRKQVMEPVPHLAALAPDLKVPEPLDFAIQKAVAKQPDQRFATMTDFAQALVAIVPTVAMGAYAAETSSADGGATLLKGGVAEKTSHAASPYDRPRVRSRAGLIAGAVVGGLALAAGGAWLAKHGEGKAPPAGWEELDKAQAAETGRRSGADASLSSVGAQASEPTAGAAVAAQAQQAQQGTQAGAQDAASVRLLAETAMFGQAHNEYLAGRLETAGQMLKSIPADSSVREKVVELQGQIDELGALMAKADGLYRRGQCREAIAVYERVRSRNPGIGGASQGIARCRREMPAGTLE
jgi:serine/threonine-protein kinase